MEQFATPEERLLLACHRGDRQAALAIVRDNEGIVTKLGPVDRRALTDEAWTANAPAVELMLELGFDPGEGDLGAIQLREIDGDAGELHTDQRLRELEVVGEQHTIHVRRQPPGDGRRSVGALPRDLGR
jgi:hypothetical protein